MRPTLLVCCHPLTGHVTPVLGIAAGLRRRGWRVAFLSASLFRARIEAAGLEFVPLVGSAAGLDDATLFDRGDATLEGLAPDVCAALPPSVTDARYQALHALPAEWASLKAALATVAATSERVLVVAEAFFYGALALALDAPIDCPQRVPRTLCISITAPALRRPDLPPFGRPGGRATTDDARAAVAAEWDAWEAQTQPLADLLRARLADAGVAPARLADPAVQAHTVYMAGAPYVFHDAVAQVGVPSLELARPLPAGFEIVGIVPPAVPSGPPSVPWWPVLVANAECPPGQRKQVVVVAQGTVETDARDLILPTLTAVARRPDTLCVAILGVRGATLHDTPPANVLVADYLAYDAVLPYADLWVHNGGYGATTHGIAHGVPMVLAGVTQDKPENAKRVAACGLGIDMHTARPSVDALHDAITRVLSDPSFAAVARALQAEYRSLDCVANVERLIEGLL